MIDGSGAPESAGEQVAKSPSPSEADFPDEPFPCPDCGQMLAPSCRVCVICKQPIDPARIRKLRAGIATLTSQPTVRPLARARFSWQIFLVVLVLWVVAAATAQKLLGPTKAQQALLSVVLISSAWVFYDARQKGVPRPARWGLGSLLLWIVFFPWYLARRKTPEAACPLIEAEATPLVRALLLVLLLLFLLGAVGLIVKKG
jgi:hypothetical protein